MNTGARSDRYRSNPNSPIRIICSGNVDNSSRAVTQHNNNINNTSEWLKESSWTSLMDPVHTGVRHKHPLRVSEKRNLVTENNMTTESLLRQNGCC